MLHYPSRPHLETGATLVTVIPEINQMQFSDEHGKPAVVKGTLLPSIVEPPKVGAAEQHLDGLVDIYFSLGEGEHLTMNAENPSPTVVVRHAGKMHTYFPPELMDYRPQDKRLKTRSTIAFTPMMFARRRATPEELAIYEARVQEAGDEAILYDYEHTRDTDANKLDLTTRDHARITFKNDTYVVPFDTADAILLVRTMQVLSEQAGSEILPFDYEKFISRDVWDKMPLAERALFTDDRAELYVPSQGAEVIRARVKSTIGSLFSTIGVVSHNSHSLSLNIRRHPVKLGIEAAPREYPPTVRYIFPPGTDKDLLLKKPPEAPSELELETANRYIAWSETPRSIVLTPEQCVEMLDDIMSEEGRRALQQALSQRPTSPENRKKMQTTLSDLHAMLRSRMGWAGYTVACRNRLIAGNTGTNRGAAIRQIGGALSGSTTKWHIGTRYEHSPRTSKS